MTTTVDPPPARFGAGWRVFIDTNILMYAMSAAAPLRAAAVAALNDLARSGAEAWVSRQVLREYLAGMTRPQPFATPVPMAAALADVTLVAARFRVAEDGPPVFAELTVLLGSVPCGGRQVYDANIVATMLAYGIPTLLTHNVKDFLRFAGYVTVAPLVP